MSTPAALPAINTLLKLGNGASPEVFTTIANVSSITGLQLSANVVDVTSHSTAVPWRQKITTLLDAGDLTFDLFFIPSDTAHQGLLTIFQEKNGTTNGLRNYQLWFPDGVPTKYEFAAYISKFSMTEAVDNVVRAAVTFTATGQPDFSA
jgi:predicted secreted protein